MIKKPEGSKKGSKQPKKPERAAKGSEAKREEAAAFLKWMFASTRGGNQEIAHAGYALMKGNAVLREALLVQRNVVDRLARVSDGTTFTGMPADGVSDDIPRFMPLYLFLADWPEFLSEDGVQVLREAPLLESKLLVAAGSLGADVEKALEAKVGIDVPRRPEAALIGLYASSLGLHGRYKRALALLHWLDECRPGQADTAKRLANICWDVDNREAAIRWQRAAIGAAPTNSLLHLSMAIRMSRIGRLKDTHDHLELAEHLWPGLEFDTIGQV